MHVWRGRRPPGWMLTLLLSIRTYSKSPVGLGYHEAHLSPRLSDESNLQKHPAETECFPGCCSIASESRAIVTRLSLLAPEDMLCP